MAGWYGQHLNYNEYTKGLPDINEVNWHAKILRMRSNSFLPHWWDLGLVALFCSHCYHEVHILTAITINLKILWMLFLYSFSYTRIS